MSGACSRAKTRGGIVEAAADVAAVDAGNPRSIRVTAEPTLGDAGIGAARARSGAGLASARGTSTTSTFKGVSPDPLSRLLAGSNGSGPFNAQPTRLRCAIDPEAPVEATSPGLP